MHRHDHFLPQSLKYEQALIITHVRTVNAPRRPTFNIHRVTFIAAPGLPEASWQKATRLRRPVFYPHNSPRVLRCRTNEHGGRDALQRRRIAPSRDHRGGHTADPHQGRGGRVANSGHVSLLAPRVSRGVVGALGKNLRPRRVRHVSRDYVVHETRRRAARLRRLPPRQLRERVLLSHAGARPLFTPFTYEKTTT